MRDFYRKLRYRKLTTTEEINLFTSKVENWNEVSLNLVLPCNWFEGWRSQRPKKVELQSAHEFASVILLLHENCRRSVYAGFSTGFGS